MERSPELALLGDLSGQVVRIWQLTELHVFNPERILHAADATGRLRAAPDDSDEDLMQAAAILLDPRTGLPGADNILDMHVAFVLDPRDDELADFRPVHPPEFDTGRQIQEFRLRRPDLA